MKRHLSFWVALFVFLSSCGSSGSPTFSETSDSGVGELEKRALANDATSPANESFAPSLTERLIIRNASLDLVVQDTEASVAQINQLVGELEGFVVSSQMTAFDEGVRASLTVRVPAESLDSALERIRALATEVRRQTISGQDVTEEYTDLQAQLRHLCEPTRLHGCAYPVCVASGPDKRQRADDTLVQDPFPATHPSDK